MGKIKFAILGLGNRGTVYATHLHEHAEDVEITAIADPRKERTDLVNKFLQLSEDQIYHDADALLSQPKLADFLVIATQDAQHKGHAIRAMELGYDLLLEKPISNKLSECVEIANTAKRLGRRVYICHVLRYTVFYQQAKRLIDEGFVGKVMSIEADEKVGYAHYMHSYVRGNWHNQEASSPMILAKCSHDMDIITWLAGQPCKALSSFGSLDYFTAENCPEGAADRCADCQLDCPFHADKYYTTHLDTTFARVVSPVPTPEDLVERLKTADYGRCVYKMDNSVVDHQVVSMLLENNITVTFQMTAFNNVGGRYLRVMGTEGEIWGEFGGDYLLHYRRFGEEEHVMDVKAMSVDTTGHGGGDARLVTDIVRLLRGDEFDTSSITTIDRSVESHYMAFAAEASRQKEGQLIRLADFKKEIGA